MNSCLSYLHYYCFLCEKIAYYPYRTPCLKTICEKCLSSIEEVYYCKYCSMKHLKGDTKFDHFKREKIQKVQSLAKKSPSKGDFIGLYQNSWDCPCVINDISTVTPVFNRRKKRGYNEMKANEQPTSLFSSLSYLKDKDQHDDDINYQLNLLQMKLEGNDSIAKQYAKGREITVGDEYPITHHKKAFKY